MTIQNRIYQQKIKGLQENTAGMGNGMNQPQTPPRGPMKPGIANTTRNMQSGGAQFTGHADLDGGYAREVAKFFNSGIGSGAEFPWPPRFSTPFASTDGMDLGQGANDSNSGYAYWASMASFLTGVGSNSYLINGQSVLNHWANHMGYGDLQLYGGPGSPNILLALSSHYGIPNWMLMEALFGASYLYPYGNAFYQLMTGQGYYGHPDYSVPFQQFIQDLFNDLSGPGQDGAHFSPGQGNPAGFDNPGGMG